MIDVLYEGNGFAYVNITNPFDGELVTLYATPYEGETVDDIVAWDENGYYIAMYQHATEQQFSYNEAWGLMTIKITFSGETPPPPPPTPDEEKHKMPIWMYPILRRKRK